MGMRDAAASPNAWLGFVTTQLKEHDNSWPKSLDSDDGLSESERESRDRLRERWQSQRNLYAQDVKLAAEAVGLIVDARGYPMLPEPVQEEARNGFLSPEDASRLHAMLGRGTPDLGASAQPYAQGAMEVAAQLLAPIMDGMHERMDREREQSRAVGEDGELRFKQIASSHVRENSDGTAQVFVLALDVEGRMWCAFVYPSGMQSTWWRVSAKAETE